MINIENMTQEEIKKLVRNLELEIIDLKDRLRNVTEENVRMRFAKPISSATKELVNNRKRK